MGASVSERVTQYAFEDLGWQATRVADITRQAGVSHRTFYTYYQNKVALAEDGRVAVLPENGLPVGQFTAVPKVDLAGVEVLVGPGDAAAIDAATGTVIWMVKPGGPLRGAPTIAT